MAEENNNNKKPILPENSPKSRMPKVKFNFYWVDYKINGLIILVTTLPYFQQIHFIIQVQLGGW